MKRVMCLYRVSTKGQVDPEDDIPMQRRECLEFISQHKDWKYIGELMEKGVSGYKVSMNKRDAIVQMRAMAEEKEFDILLVFMFDRLGRREDETPFLVQWFIENGIE
ncbi:MAG: recombinase family protein, partial [Lachnospiraceae bacterium]|nr:recombinase family protein [Lachnospiraceae bacterium]